MIYNIKKGKKENNNENKSQSRFSDYLREEDYEEEVNKIKEIKINSQENNNSKNDDTSISHIVEDVNYDKKFGDIYNEMCQILRHSLFIFTVEEDKISINYKNNKNKKYEDLIKDMGNFKTKILELIDNCEKFINFLEKVKNEIIKAKIIKKYNLNIELELYEKIENLKSNHKYINCKFKINKYNNNNFEKEKMLFEKYNNFEEKIFIEKDILYDISLQNFNNFIDNLNENEKKIQDYLINENFSIKNIEIMNNPEDNNSYILEHTRDFGQLKREVIREKINQLDIKKHDQEYEMIEMEDNFYKHKEEMKKSKISEEQILKFNNSNNFIISNNQQIFNSEHPQMFYFNPPFYLPGENRFITDVINILKHSTINLNSKKEFDFNIIKFWDNTLLKEIKYSDFENELKNKDQKFINDNDYNNNLFDNFEKLIDFIKKIKKIAEEKFKIYKFDIFEIKLTFKEVEDNNNKIKNISCNYSIVTQIINKINDKNYTDVNILSSDNYHNYEEFLEDIGKNI